MNLTRRIVLALAGVGLFAGAGSVIVLSGQPAMARGSETLHEPASYQVDAVHSSVIFKIKHMDVSNFYGRMNGPAGSFTLGDTASFEVTLPAEQVDSGNKKRDDHIRSDDFFSAAEHPEIKFSGKDFKMSGENVYKGSGDLTFRGVTKPVEVTVTKVGEASGERGRLAGIEATFTIKRSDFGNKLAKGLSDEVTIIAALEGRGR